MKCSKCGSDYSENYYKDKYSGSIICEECLLELDEIETSTITNYYINGEYIGDDNEIADVIDNICDNLSFEKVKEE